MRARSLLLGILLSSTPVLAEELADKGRPAPMFRLPVYNAQTVGLRAMGLDRYVGPAAQDKEAKVILVSFTASYCPPCRKELPWLQQISEKYKGQGLRIVMVSIDEDAEGQQKMQALLDEHKITFPVLKDRFKLVARRWLGNEAKLPSVFLVDTAGTVTTSHRGYDDEVVKSLEQEILSALGQGAPRPVAATGAP